jgi:dTDP-4-dehydrorhamnose reductase
MSTDGARLPLLVTGITGVAGFNALRYFQRRFPGQVIGIRPRRTERLVGPGIVALEAEDRGGLRELFQTYRFRSVLHAAGNCALKACELDPAMARLLNVVGAESVATTAAERGARLVHLSTDLVFSGNGSGDYTEDAATDPVSVYGRTMAEGETVVRACAPEAAILRISLPMGPSFNRHAGAIDWIWSRFRAGRAATLYFDEVRSCSYCDDLNPVFARFLEGDEFGLYHAGGPRPMTLYQIGQLVNRVGGYAPGLLKGCLRREAGPIPPRAGNVSLCSAKLVELLGHEPCRAWPTGEDLLPHERDWHQRRAAEESGSYRCIVERLYHAECSRLLDTPLQSAITPEFRDCNGRLP